MNLIKEVTVRVDKQGRDIETVHLYTEDRLFKIEEANEFGDYNVFKGS